MATLLMIIVVFFLGFSVGIQRTKKKYRKQQEQEFMEKMTEEKENIRQALYTVIDEEP